MTGERTANAPGRGDRRWTASEATFIHTRNGTMKNTAQQEIGGGSGAGPYMNRRYITYMLILKS